MKKNELITYFILLSVIIGGFFFFGRIGSFISGFTVALLIFISIGKAAYDKSVDSINRNVSDIITEMEEEL